MPSLGAFPTPDERHFLSEAVCPALLTLEATGQGSMLTLLGWPASGLASSCQRWPSSLPEDGGHSFGLSLEGSSARCKLRFARFDPPGASLVDYPQTDEHATLAPDPEAWGFFLCYG